MCAVKQVDRVHKHYYTFRSIDDGHLPFKVRRSKQTLGFPPTEVCGSACYATNCLNLGAILLFAAAKGNSQSYSAFPYFRYMPLFH